MDKTIVNSSPTRIGKYEIRQTIGRGAMGVVYEGFDPDIEREVAIKTLHKHLIEGTQGQDFADRFKREARAAARCEHKNIVSVLEYGDHEGMPYIVMEYVRGIGLDRVLSGDKAISYKRLFSILGQILSALHTAHAEGVVHRDIKPANIILLKGSKVKLADFGVARLERDGNRTEVGVAVGTPRYMAPEQLYGHKTDARADLFSLTMVLLQMLAKVAPNSRVAMTRLPAIAGLPYPEAVNPDRAIPVAFEDLIVHGLAAEPKQRIASTSAYAAKLRGIIQTLSSGTQTSVRPVAAQALDEQQSFEQQMEMGSVLNDSGVGSGVWTTNTDLRHNNVNGFASAIDERTQSELTADLAKHIGPLASVLIRQEAESAISYSELIHALAQHITVDKKRQKFLDTWATPI